MSGSGMQWFCNTSARLSVLRLIRDPYLPDSCNVVAMEPRRGTGAVGRAVIAMQPSPDIHPSVRPMARRSMPHYSARAPAIWPRPDRARLSRTRGDPAAITRLVMRRTSLSFEGIMAVLTGDPEADR